MDPEPLAVAGRHIGSGEHTFFVAEEGQANMGNLEVAIKMVWLAAEAGADAIEFQLAIAEDFYVRDHPAFEMYREREFSRSQLEQLFASADEAGIIAYAAPLSSHLVPMLVDIGCPLFNINASDLDNPDMLDTVGGSGRPFFVSTLMATLDEIDWAVERLLGQGYSNFALLHGQHVMFSDTTRGVPEDQTNLETISFLRARYGLNVGFIDHTSNPRMPGIAAAVGAAIVCKHFTWDKSLQGPDWQVCLEPEELKQAVQLVKFVDGARGSRDKQLIEGELTDRLGMRRSIVAAIDLPKGTLLTDEHLRFKRPGDGMPPPLANQLVGKLLSRPLKADEQLTLEHIE